MLKEKTSKAKVIWNIIKIGYKVNKFYFFACIITSVFMGIAPVGASYFFATLINKISHGEFSVNSIMLITMVICYIAFLLLTEASDELSNVISNLLYRYDMDVYLVNAVVTKVASLDIEFFENPEFAVLKSNVQDGFEWRIVDMLRDIFRSFGHVAGTATSLLALVYIYPIPALAIFLSIIPSIIIDFVMQEGIWNIWTMDADTRRKYGNLLDITRSTYFVKELKTLGVASFFINQLIGMMRTIYNNQKRIQWKRTLFLILAALLPLSCAGFFIVRLSNDVIRGVAALGTLSFFVSTLFTLRDKFTSSLYYVSQIVAASRYAGLFLEFINVQPKIVSKKDAVDITGLIPSIELKNVSFKYPGTDKYIFKNFNLKINAGEKVAIVGENGAGKSTLIKLLMRFYDVNKGNILINGIDIKDIKIESLRKNFAVLLQDFVNFNMITVEENIALGDLDKYKGDMQVSNGETPQAIIDAARNSKAESFILKNEKGFKEPFGRDFGGVDFSGGERQRVALARTFYKNAGLVIMDEPTSAVDAKAEAEIFESLREHLNGKTVIFVSHRFSTVRNADRIIVIENGVIEEDGKHQDLFKQNGLYRQLYSFQAKGYE